jgi:nitrate reductase gamma subunit
VSTTLAVLAWLSMLVFAAGLCWRVARWLAAPVQFAIPTTAGQQKSLPWIRASWMESPWTPAGAGSRVLLEVLLFRSLFRNTSTRLDPKGPRLSFVERKGLWVGALLFHWSLLLVVVRHSRFFFEQVPWLVTKLAAADSFLQLGSPRLYLSDAVLLASLSYLAARRIGNPLMRYTTLPADYAVLALLLGVAGTGVVMRYFVRTDVVAVKEFASGVASFGPVALRSPDTLFVVHLVLACVLVAILPFTKMVHSVGVFFSPTRNVPNDTRTRRHVSSWNPPVEARGYEEWAEEFKDSIAKAQGGSR